MMLLWLGLGAVTTLLITIMVWDDTMIDDWVKKLWLIVFFLCIGGIVFVSLQDPVKEKYTESFKTNKYDNITFDKVYDITEFKTKYKWWSVRNGNRTNRIEVREIEK